MPVFEEFNRLKNLPHETIVDIVGNQYIYEYGESKTIDTIKKIAESSKMSEVYNQIHFASSIVSPKDLLYVINGLSFFLFAKSETICLSSVSFAGEVFKDKEGITNSYKVDYLMNLLNMCERMKFNKTNTFYTRVYSKIIDEYNSLVD